MKGVVMNSVCHYAVVCCAMLCYAVICSELLCALAGGIVKGEEKSSNHAVVFGSRAAIVHVGDGGVSRGVLRETDGASKCERSRHHGCDGCRGPSR